MQKRDAVVSLRDAELQARLTGGGGDAEAPRENGTGKKHAVASPGLDPIHKSPCNQSKMLVGLDILCLFLVSIPFFVCEFKVVVANKRGFFCGDTSIMYPYFKSESIPDSVLISGGIIITGLTIALGECYRVRYRNVHSRAFVRNLYVSTLYKELGSFLFGCCVGQSLTNMAKLGVGRLRPHFLSVCNITYALLGCKHGEYVSDFTCEQDEKMVEEARKSFFSGHASFAMYTLLYLAFYLQARLTWRGARLLRPMLQFLLVLLAVYTGLSRISDYRHHPTDVLTGFLQGALTAYWVAFYISSMFKTSHHPCRSPTSLSSIESPLSSQQTDC